MSTSEFMVDDPTLDDQIALAAPWQIWTVARRWDNRDPRPHCPYAKHAKRVFFKPLVSALPPYPEDLAVLTHTATGVFFSVARDNWKATKRWLVRRLGVVMVPIVLRDEPEGGPGWPQEGQVIFEEVSEGGRYITVYPSSGGAKR